MLRVMASAQQATVGEEEGLVRYRRGGTRFGHVHNAKRVPALLLLVTWRRGESSDGLRLV